jgi:hypothetical protein
MSSKLLNLLEKQMRNIFLSMSLLSFAVLLTFPETSLAQSVRTPDDEPNSEKIIGRMSQSVVVVLVGTGSGSAVKIGSGIIVKQDGVILTAYHVVKDAFQVQIRLKNGEIYDKVDLIGFDERRDVAALKISASKLPAIRIANYESKVGSAVYAVSNPQSLNWTVSDGVVNSLRISDDIPNAGQGFRVIQFSAPISSGSSGGLLADENGQAIGVITSSILTGQNLNFAVPIASVIELAESSKIAISFGKGNELETVTSVRPPSSIEILNADPYLLLANARLFYISSNSELISDKMIEDALMKMPEFEKWKLAIITEWGKADININVEHQLFTFDYRYTMTDRRTSRVLGTGKVTVWDGNIASKKFAKMIIAKLKEIRKTEEKPNNKIVTEKKSSN